jgi:hypothetical protein
VRPAVYSIGNGFSSIAFGTDNALYGVGAVDDSHGGVFRFHLDVGTYEVLSPVTPTFRGGSAITVDRPVLLCSCLVPFDRDVLLGPKDGGTLPFGVDLFDTHGNRIDAATLPGGPPRLRIEYEPFNPAPGAPTAELVLEAKLDGKGHIDVDSKLLAKPGRYYVVPVGRSGYDLEPTCIGRIIRKS